MVAFGLMLDEGDEYIGHLLDGGQFLFYFAGNPAHGGLVGLQAHARQILELLH